MTAAAEAGLYGDIAWVKYADAEAKKCGQTLVQVYGRSANTLKYWVGTARYLSEEVIQHFHKLYDEDVSTK